MKNLINESIGRYKVKEIIGEGAMAKVYCAYDPDINRSLALKVLKSDFTGDEEHLSRFVREAKAGGALSHPNIVTVFDVGEVDSSPYILMELLSGNDIAKQLTKQSKFSVRDTLTIALQLAKALDYAHGMGVVHRDIKPDNILLLDDGVSIKIADFGIARVHVNEDAAKTVVGSVLGTPRYMSPEQALGKEVDGRTDLYSAGVIMYEMLTGEKAFDAINLGTLMTQIIQQQPTPLKELCPNLPSGLCHIIQKLLQKQPEKRFQSGADLAKALGREIDRLDEQQEINNRDKYIPLKVRWTLYMAGLVAAFMAISVSVVFNIQAKAMAKQAVDSGTAFAKFIAIETAVPLLSEDWITLETFIHEAATRKTFTYLIVTDRDGIVRGASDINLVGEKYQPIAATTEVLEIDNVRTTSVALENGEEAFNLEAPILFQNVNIGKIVMGLSKASLNNVQSITGWLMFSLALITTLSVSAILFFFGGLISKPLRVATDSIRQFGEGDSDVRISLTRNDEIGELFAAFNSMASNLQQITKEEIPPESADPLNANLPEELDDDATIVFVNEPEQSDLLNENNENDEKTVILNRPSESEEEQHDDTKTKLPNQDN